MPATERFCQGPAEETHQRLEDGHTLNRNLASDTEARGFPQGLLNTGFCMALVLAGACLIMGGYYLCSFLTSTDHAIEDMISQHHENVSEATIELAMNARMVMARIALNSCGVFVGMSFGFLGFALLLLGIKGEMDVDARSEGYRVKIARMSPGVFVILCAAVLIAVCVTRQTPFKYTRERQGGVAEQGGERGPGPDIKKVVDDILEDNEKP